MKCNHCGKEINSTDIFCPECGCENTPTEPISNKPQSQSDSVNVSNKAKEIWVKLDLFEKIILIALLISLLFAIIAFFSHNKLNLLLSTSQLGGFFVALLFHKNKIKCELKWMKYAICATALFLSLLTIGNSFGSLEFEKKTSKVSTPFSASECIGDNAQTVINDLTVAGFTNIISEVVEDLELSDNARDNELISISINGKNDFKGNEKFKSNSKIVVKYHSFKRITVPCASEQVERFEPAALIDKFEDAGFINVSAEEVYDLDPDNVDYEFKNEVIIDGLSTFKEIDTFPLDANVKIVTHRTFNKYNLNISIDFIGNLLFNRYDVEFKIGNKTELLNHGTDATFNYKLAEGEYTLYFSSEESDDISKTVSLKLSGNTNASYRVTCFSEEIKVETLYVENLNAAGENEAIIPSSASSCKYENYSDIETLFKNAGFTNITTKIQYDIVWGITKEGEVASVSVDGKTDFVRGNVFPKDAPVVITYHMKASDDPNKQSSASNNSNSASSTEKILTVDNDPQFASLLKNTKATDYTKIKEFVRTHQNVDIMFDGCVVFMMNHSDYSTRFDVCLAYGDFDASKTTGPLFSFENVNFYDMNVSGTDIVEGGMDFTITATIKGYNDDGKYIILKPISMKAR